MKLPYPKHMDNTPVVVSLTEGINANGAQNVVAIYDGKCRYVEKAVTVRDSEGKLIKLEGKAYIGCDIAPAVRLLEGHATINGKTMKIHKGSRPRNPDGSVHHTELELI
jgi:hypothetical protein